MRTKLGPFLLFILFTLPLASAQLKNGFYSTSCPNAESIIFNAVQNRFATDKSITPALLRMHFHDCFVSGCDASLLLDSTNTTQSEKEAGPNLTVRGYDLIDEIKKALEAACPLTVSCADIIALSTRDAVALADGPNYTVPIGRRDSLQSHADEVDLPGPDISVSGAQQVFQAKGFSPIEMVTLLGAHTVGVAHCSFFQNRLTGFGANGGPDPTMNSTLLAKLNSICNSASANNPDPSAFLDQSTSFVVDNRFYGEILMRSGVLQIDQELALAKSTAPMVSRFASNPVQFQQSFANAMIKLASFKVLVGNAGEIRQNCRVVNPVKTQIPPLNPGNKPKPPLNQGKKPIPKTNNQGKNQKPKPKPNPNPNPKAQRKPIQGGKGKNPKAF